MMLPLLTLFSMLPQEPLWMPSVFSENMVLQREKPIPVFGTAEPGSTVEVRLGTVNASTKTGNDGRFKVVLKPMEAGGPYRMEIKASGQRMVFDNVLIGEVWVASGQSNMEWPLSLAHGYEQERQNDPALRMFTVTKVSTEEPAKDVVGAWQQATPDTVGGFSAVGYYFAKELREKLKVPVGVIHTSWGGTPAESWTSREKLLSSPNLRYMVERHVSDMSKYPERLQLYREAVMPWRKKAFPQETDNLGEAAGWHKNPFTTRDWQTMVLPTLWEDAWNRPFDGAVWFRREVEIAPEMAGKELTLSLGPIDDTDNVYFNGERIGGLGWDVPSVWMVPREYKVPAALVRPGVNLLAVRVFDSSGGGGIYGQPSQMFLTDGASKLPLDGAWLCKIEQELIPPKQDILNQQPQEPTGPGNAWAPGGLYNGMVAPIIPYAIRGAIWYQGESNAGRAYQYRELFPAMIQDWRARWGQGDFPFLFVQLANFMGRNPEPVDSAWAELREAQTMTLALPKTGMAVAIDIGEAEDIHPRNKKDVGKRLAYWTLARDYKVKVPASGPLYRSNRVTGNSMRIKFDHAHKGLRSSDGRPVVGFAVAGEDRKFYWASASIVGDTVVVSSPKVAKPVAVRYGWSDNPDVNLVNGEGLPASPFRTDTWDGVTKGAR